MPTTERLAYTRKETAALLGVSLKTLDRLVAAGRIKPVYLGANVVRFTATSIDALLAGEQE